MHVRDELEKGKQIIHLCLQIPSPPFNVCSIFSVDSNASNVQVGLRTSCIRKDSRVRSRMLEFTQIDRIRPRADVEAETSAGYASGMSDRTAQRREQHNKRLRCDMRSMRGVCKRGGEAESWREETERLERVLSRLETRVQVQFTGQARSRGCIRTTWSRSAE